MPIPAVITAGDGRAAKAVYGESKVYLELAGRPMVAHVAVVLQQVPEISEVWVVGNAERLRAVFEAEDVKAQIHKPLHILEQFRNLYENAWESYRRLLPGAPAEGRDPASEADLDTEVLYLSGDLPFATPQEISVFIQRTRATGCDYGVGLVEDSALQGFLPLAPGEPGVDVAYFNIREARYRQNNLHLAKPARIINRYYIEEMYEHRHQQEFGNMLGLAWRLLRSEQGGLTILFFYALMHLAGLADRRGWARLADWFRRAVTLARVEAALSKLMRTHYRFVVTDVGGCAIDVDTEEEYDAVVARYEEWTRAQRQRAEELHGRIALPESGSESKPEPDRSDEPDGPDESDGPDELDGSDESDGPDEGGGRERGSES